MLSFIIGLVCFIGGVFFLSKKLDFDSTMINGLLAGFFFFSGMSSLSKVIVGLITMNSVIITAGLISLLIDAAFCYWCAKDGGLI